LYEENESLWKLMQTAFQALNQTRPNFTSSCWLCCDIKPPLYEAVGLNSTYSTSKEDGPAQCAWEEKRTGLTLQQVGGRG
ncbi:ENV1 protein, partial [Tricholaema leucomelas]|nr:ENV1 protein [Tricholaema leucomelas]